MQINKIRGENFLSFEQFELNLRDRGLICIEGENVDLGGSNGAGKSSIMEALVWCLFGTTSRGLKSSAVVREDENHEPVGNCVVAVEIDLDGVTVHVARHRDHKKWGNKMLLVANGQDMTMGSDKETQLRLQEMLQLDYESFIATVMYPQKADGFPGLSDSEQKAILERVLVVGRFAEAQKRAKDRLKRAQERLDLVDKQLLVTQSRLESTEQQIRKLTSQHAEWQANHAQRLRSSEGAVVEHRKQRPVVDGTLETRLQDVATKLQSYDLTNLNSQESDLRKVITTAQARSSMLSGTITTLQSQAKSVPVEPQRSNQTVQDLTKLLAATRAAWSAKRAENKLLASQIADLAAKIDKKNQTVSCATCGQALSQQAKDRLFGSFDSQLAEKQAASQLLTKELLELDDGIAKLETVQLPIAQAHADWVRLKSMYEDGKKMLEAALDERETIEAGLVTQLAQHKKLQETLLQASLLISEQQKLQSEKQNQQHAVKVWELSQQGLEDSLEKCRKETSPYLPLVADQETAATALAKEKMVEESFRSKVAEDVAYLEFWVDGFGNQGVKSLLFDTVTPYLSFRGNEYLEVLSNGTGRLQFHTQATLASGELRDRFNVEAVFQGGGSGYEKLSGGEGRRVDISTLFALGDLAASRSMVPVLLRILDEPFENLDAPGAEQVVRLLREKILPSSRTIMVVTHDDNLKSLMDNRVLVRKERGVSQLIEG